MNALRILLLAPDSNPESFSSALVGYCHGEALARLHSVTLVVRRSNEEAVLRKQAPFRAVEAISLPWLDRIFAWSFRWIFRNDYAAQAVTAFSYPFALAFEWSAWRRLRTRIMAGDFDVVLRLNPVTSVLPSLFAYLLRRGPVPFVIGPINGGLPWPKGFSQTQRQREWVSNLRTLYRLMPFARSTYRDAAAIVAGSSQTYAEFSAYREKLFFVPENGISASLCTDALCSLPRSDRLELIFVGGLIPRKGCDLALRAAAPLLRKGLARFTIVGDGPERKRLEQLTSSLEIEEAVSFCGWLIHSEALKRMRAADVLVFPSLREFGGAVVLEAIAMGAVPVVVDFGGPGDIVHPGVGYKVSLTNEGDVVCQIEKILANLERDRDLLYRLRQQGMRYARECLSWEGKAQIMTQILTWAVGRGPKPDVHPPKTSNQTPAGTKGAAQRRGLLQAVDQDVVTYRAMIDTES